MASRRKTPLRPTDDDVPPTDAGADDFDDAFDDDDEFESAIGGGARRSTRGAGRGARSLPHDWADFDYGGGVDNDWR